MHVCVWVCVGVCVCVCGCVCVGVCGWVGSIHSGPGVAGCLVTKQLCVAGRLLPPESSVAERHTLTALKTAGAVARRSYSGCLATEASLFQSCLRTFSVIVSSIATVIPCCLHQWLQLHFILWNQMNWGQFCFTNLPLNRKTVPVWAHLAIPFFIWPQTMPIDLWR